MKTSLALFTLTLSLPLLCACSSNDKGQPRRPLTVEVSEPSVGRADSLRIFQMNYGNNQYIVEKEGGTWGSLTWPSGVGDEQKIDIYAYNSGTFHYNEGTPYITFTADELLRSQKDLCVATHKQIAYSDTDGAVSLRFSHVCAMVKVRVKSVSEETITVNKVTLRHVKKQGNYHYNSTPHWTDISNEGDYTLTTADIVLGNSYQQLPCGYIYMIPQRKDGIMLGINYTVGGTSKTKMFALTGEWQEGKEDEVLVEM